MYLFYVRKRSKGNWLAIILIGMYCLSAIASWFLYSNNPALYSGVNIGSYIYLFLSLIIAFSPITNYQQERYTSLENMNIKVANFFAVFLILLFGLGIIGTITAVINDFNTILLDYTYAGELYADNREAVSNQTGSSFANVGAVLRGVFSEVLVVFTFYYLTLKKKNKIISLLLCFVALSPFLSSFSRGSRTVMTWWGFETVVSFLMFNKFYEKKMQKTIRKVLTIVFAGGILVFAVLTIGRFTYNRYSSLTAEESIISYIGQGTLNFSDLVLQNKVHQRGDNCFPFFLNAIGLESSGNLYERQMRWESKMTIRQGSFYTFVGDLCNDFGPFLCLLFIILMSLLFNKSINKKNPTLSLTQVFLMFFLCCICYNGLFYFSYKSVGGNLKIISYFIILILLASSKRTPQNINNNDTINSILPTSVSSDEGK